ncbi:Rieske (2Fe-2S) protein [Erythrobacter mangrovi]|uniref:Rieske (2Fe-2S) protein n=1 Tax=Erythrobacter mangrovi TaxID=2739433 RepID=A0A7D4BF85_9SPHN|nr:Rieske (2Fe-2S) protein [Erythrobacter mangrovi]QKG70462.1 Rieske (2Fe-2S) protein [Erythrobacter mangrovi]
MELTAPHVGEGDIAAFAGRSRAVDRSTLEGLHYLGNYVRDLPVNLARMIENAYDWEHLPFVHPSSFAAIAPVDSGNWGWRCKTALPNEGGEQLIELLVDAPGHYWATTVVDGPGRGTQIHTQAAARDEGGITVDVRFYAPQAPESPAQAAMILAYLQAQYATLYDEDQALMTGRQAALDERRTLRTGDAAAQADLGLEADLDRARVYDALLGERRALVRFHGDRWIAHSARCPHALGPLEGVEPDAGGRITCPWHGYRFDLATGAEQHGRCGALALLDTSLRDGHLIVLSSA